jgi:hypothetical protein
MGKRIASSFFPHMRFGPLNVWSAKRMSGRAASGFQDGDEMGVDIRFRDSRFEIAHIFVSVENGSGGVVHRLFCKTDICKRDEPVGGAGRSGVHIHMLSQSAQSMRFVLFVIVLMLGGCVSHTPMSALASGALSGASPHALRVGGVASRQIVAGIENPVVLESPCPQRDAPDLSDKCAPRPYRGEYQSGIGAGAYVTTSDGSDLAASLTFGLGVAGVDATWWPGERVGVTGALSAPGMWAGYVTYAPVVRTSHTLAVGAYARRRSDVYGFDYPSEAHAPQLDGRTSHDAGFHLLLRLRYPSGGPAGLVLGGRAGYDWDHRGWAFGLSASVGG